MRELTALVEQVGELASSCTDPHTVMLMRDVEALLLETVRERSLKEIPDRGALDRLITETCRKPGHAVVLLDLLGQTWVGYAGAARTYVARPPSRHQVLEEITERVDDQWRPVADLEPVRFPMLALHTPSTPAHGDRRHAAEAAR